MRWLTATLALIGSLHAAAALRFEGGIRHVATKLSTSDGNASRLDLRPARGFGASLEAFWSSQASLRLATTLVNPEAILYPRTPPPNDIDLGTLGIHVTSIAARYYFRPASRVAIFAGAGGALVLPGNLDDRFGDSFRADFEREVTGVVETGLRYRLRPRVHLELGVEYLPLEVTPRIQRGIDGAIVLPDAISIDPITIGIGACWRF